MIEGVSDRGRAERRQKETGFDWIYGERAQLSEQNLKEGLINSHVSRTPLSNMIGHGHMSLGPLSNLKTITQASRLPENHKKYEILHENIELWGVSHKNLATVEMLNRYFGPHCQFERTSPVLCICPYFGVSYVCFRI
jgi:hypothetical protein